MVQSVLLAGGEGILNENNKNPRGSEQHMKQRGKKSHLLGLPKGHLCPAECNWCQEVRGPRLHRWQSHCPRCSILISWKSGALVGSGTTEAASCPPLHVPGLSLSGWTSQQFWPNIRHLLLFDAHSSPQHRECHTPWLCASLPGS